MPIVSIRSEKCTQCLACMRACPVKAIRQDANTHQLSIDAQRCIRCGVCVAHCYTRAIEVQSSVERAKRLLNSDKPVFAICDTDISAEFTDISDYRKFVSMLRALGFHKVFSSASAVDLVAKAYKDLLIDKFNGKYYITANCPVVVDLVQKYYPRLIASLAPIQDPATVSIQMVRESFPKVDVSVVYISPCIAHKLSLMAPEAIIKADAVLSFQELRDLFNEQHIHEAQMEYSVFDGLDACSGLLYPISNGILQAGKISEDLLDGHVRTTDGGHNVMTALESFDTNNEIMHTHLNLFFCEGCVMGPGTQHDKTNKFIRIANVVDYACKRRAELQSQTIEQAYDFGTLNLYKSFAITPIASKSISESEIDTIQQNSLFQDSNGQGIDCGYCGFPSCRALAQHIANGTGSKHLCVRQSANNEENYQHLIHQAHTNIQRLNSELENRKSAEQEHHIQLNQSQHSLSRLINHLTAGIVFIDERLKIVEANQHFIDTIGDEAKEIAEVIPGLSGAALSALVDAKTVNIFKFALESGQTIDRKEVRIHDQEFLLSIVQVFDNRLVVAIFRQLNEQLIDIDEMALHIQKTIDKHLSMVQEIGSILGEAASTTERDLNHIIKIIRSES